MQNSGADEEEVLDAASILIKRQRVLDKRTKKQAGRKFVKADICARKLSRDASSSSSSSSPNVASLGNLSSSNRVPT